MSKLSLAELTEYAKLFAASRMFKGCDQLAQAFVKIQAGQELGFTPFVAMNSFAIVQGKVELSADAQARLLKASGKYTYLVSEHTDEACEIQFFEIVGGSRVAIGSSRFTLQDAHRAGLTQNDTWRKYPKNMLFARALTNGVAFHCPDSMACRVYGEGEIQGELTDGQKPEERATAQLASAPSLSPSPALPAPSASQPVDQRAEKLMTLAARMSPPPQAARFFKGGHEQGLSRKLSPDEARAQAQERATLAPETPRIADGTQGSQKALPLAVGDPGWHADGTVKGPLEDDEPPLVDPETGEYLAGTPSEVPVDVERTITRILAQLKRLAPKNKPKCCMLLLKHMGLDMGPADLPGLEAQLRLLNASVLVDGLVALEGETP